MKIIITGSLGNVSKPLATQLVNAGHQVTVISQDINKTAAIKALGATAAIGSITDAAFLTTTFKGADAAYTMIPPIATSGNYYQDVAAIADNYRQALAEAGVKHVVNLSAIGAEVPTGNGLSSAFYQVEETLNQLPDTHITHLRAGMFYTNFYGNLAMILQQHIVGNNFPGDIQLALVHPQDIADAAAASLSGLTFTGKSFRYITSDEKTGNEIAQIFSTIVGQSIPWIAFPDEALQQGAMQNGFSAHMASLFAAVGISIREGRLFKGYADHQTVTGKRKFETFAAEMIPSLAV
ncbi:NmrA family NAD(P)-binding protein [Chitinophaga qingshengii]|uniref:NmrA family NAD(P)-binding protein n=1 Tax=Chitinophaga qingshengii TaxID=1569794 RepID=A0ABR7TMT5_9BACT|nr:NmrA family NAD(P)-binding protein [Chitinophaga qingshengii]MBC9931305.1 NmrA family NAD(P)-binding protein [Chitinophaga qingshengii]